LETQVIINSIRDILWERFATAITKPDRSPLIADAIRSHIDDALIARDGIAQDDNTNYD
jgi:metal-responsive CopG/Arc/MetJ family transcriptional regulator